MRSGFPLLAGVRCGRKAITNVRYSESMAARNECEFCSGRIPRRGDPRGRKARFCSDTCRAAASRKSREQRHRDEPAQVRKPDEFEFTNACRGSGRSGQCRAHNGAQFARGTRVFVTEQHRELVAAVHDLAQILDAATPASGAVAPPALRSNRAQRRAAKRR